MVVSDIDRAGCPRPASGSPPERRTLLLLSAVLLAVVALVSAVAVGVARVAWEAASPLRALYPPPAASSGGSSRSLDLLALATKVDPGLVDITTELDSQDAEAAGTGIVLNSSGEVLTNNHVINGATDISATDVGNGQTYRATVLGYDRSHDIAVLQLQGASGLHTAAIGNSATVAVGDQIAAIGNAGGAGGTPSTAAGAVSALNQTVNVTDDPTGNVERLAGLVRVTADVQPGDSGGPLVNAAGQVVGLDTAAAADFWFPSSSGEGFAIPINDAIAISKQVEADTASTTVHVGPAGVLGVDVQATRTVGPGWGRSGGPDHPATSGTLVVAVTPGSPAERAGLAAGDVIVSLDGATVDSPKALSAFLSDHHPGDLVHAVWVDPSGQQQDAVVQLAAGPPS